MTTGEGIEEEIVGSVRSVQDQWKKQEWPLARNQMNVERPPCQWERLGTYSVYVVRLGWRFVKGSHLGNWELGLIDEYWLTASWKEK